MEDSHALISSLSVGLFALILLVNIPGLGSGRWVAHFATGVTVLITTLLMALLFFHPHASAVHPHVSPQPPFSLAFRVLTVLSLNLLSKLTFNALTGLEQVAVFAGETRHAGRTILRSAWIAAPVIVDRWQAPCSPTPGRKTSSSPARSRKCSPPRSIPAALPAAASTSRGDAAVGSRHGCAIRHHRR